MGIINIALLLAYLLFFVFAAYISCAITKKIFPSLKNVVLRTALSGFLFGVILIGVALLMLYAFFGFNTETEEGVFWIFYLLGIPTSFIGSYISAAITNPLVTKLVFIICMIINTTLIGAIIGCIKHK